MDAHQILLEEHILRKNKGLPTEHPMDYAYRVEQDRLADLRNNADAEDMDVEVDNE